METLKWAVQVIIIEDYNSTQQHNNRFSFTPVWLIWNSNAMENKLRIKVSYKPFSKISIKIFQFLDLKSILSYVHNFSDFQI